MGFPLRFLSSLSLCLLALLLHRATVTSGCFSMEREALLDFKAGIHDTHNRLSSWVGQDCCAWEGVICGATTGHVKLRYLNLSSTYFMGGIPARLGNLSSLYHLDLSRLVLTNVPDWFSSVNMLPSLQVLTMSSVGLNTIPASVAHVNFTSSLAVLDLSYNNFDSTLPKWLWNINWFSSVNMLPSLQVSSLTVLDLSNNNFSSTLPKWLWNISSLTHLDLYYSGLYGVIPDAIGDLSSLTFLNLGVNQLEGSVPRSMADLRIISEVHFENLTRLQVLDLSYNPITISIGQSWVPPFQLRLVYLTNCQLGPQFPDWLQFQTQIQGLSMDYCKIAGTMPAWFWNISSSTITYLFLSNNQIGGKLPSSLKFTKLEILDLDSNRFEGQLPIWPYIPYCLGKSLQNLRFLDLSNNHFFSGEVPLSLKNCTNLWFLDLTQNNLVGSITLWMGENLRQLQVLRLRSNMFSGVIPCQLARFEQLQILDLANNNFSGSIPHNIGNLSSMRSTSQYYGFYTKRSWRPCELNNLNLSRNHLQGKIPWEIGGMKSLESLDLSINDLSGSIPESLSVLYSLSYLNLSYNNLSGRIPTGYQLQTLNDPSIYMGNADLCGPPTSKSCFNNKTTQNIIQEYKKEIPEWLWFYISMVLGYVMGFWTFYSILFLKDAWRHTYFHMIDHMYDWFWVQ
uniref:Leucine-rich repeat-containing N-terminal plant-type domain-containing protein n=1 Tax=Musa acuminata subsp. malaccensis TaxID=214687 RepID=A0A804KR25_MUSAM